VDAEFKEYLHEELTTFAQHILHEMDLRFTTVNTRLESIDARLKLQAGLIQSGARAMARFSEFSESSEARHTDLAERFESLERRVTDLESGKRQQ